jgi:isoleucyl-tRNA synthetase
MLDETGREMHGSWGNMIDAEDAFARMGADVMRWQYCAQPPNQNLLFGFGPGQEIKGKLLRLWNSVRVLVLYGNVAGWRPRLEDLSAPDGELAALDRWLVERTRALARDAESGYEATLTVNVVREFDAFVDDLSNWYIRRSRRRFWDGDEAALRTLWFALATAARVIGPVMPFLAEELWQRLVRGPVEGAPASVFLAGWPELGPPDDALLEEIGAVRRVVELGRQARATSGLKQRQPLRRLVVQGSALPAHAEELRDELRVKEVEFGEVEATEVRVKPNLPVLGPKLGAGLADVRRALAAGEFEQLDGGRFAVAGHELGPEEVLVETVGREGWAVASDDGLTVAVETAVVAEVELEGRAYDLLHELNTLRRDGGFELTDRVRIVVPEAWSDVLDRHGERVAGEVLAVGLAAGDVAEPQIEKV